MVRQLKKGGTYYYQFFKNGKRYNGVCTNCTTKRDAEEYEKKFKCELNKLAEQKNVRALVENFRDELTGGENITIANAYKDYLQKPSKRTAGEKQIRTKQSYWSDFAAFMEKRYPDVETLANVRKKHAEEYISLLRQSGAFIKDVSFSRAGHTMTYTPQNEMLSPRTINARHKALKSVFSRLAADAGLLENPFDIPTMDNQSTSRAAFTSEELKRIGENMTMPYTRPIFTIGLCTGLTTGDICLLKWSEISGNWITNKKRRKTGAKLEIPILPPLAAFLDEQRPRSGGSEYVCPELAAMYQANPSGVFYRVKEFLEGIGIKTAEQIEGRSRAVSTKAAHAMRHTFAYLAGVYNIPQPIVQGVLGHMTPEMTAMYQQHAQREQKEKFFRQMPDLLGVSTPTAMIGGTPEPEREELRRLADTLPIEQIRKMLAMGKSENGLEK